MDCQTCPRCDRTLSKDEFPPRRLSCRNCYSQQVAACHRRAHYVAPPASINQIRAWRLLTQLRNDARQYYSTTTKLPVTAAQIMHRVLCKHSGKGIALLPTHAEDGAPQFTISKLRVVSLDQRRAILIPLELRRMLRRGKAEEERIEPPLAAG